MDHKTLLVGAAGAVLGAAAAALVLTHTTKAALTRWGTTPRASAAVSHGGVVHLSGQVGIIDRLDTSTITEQTRETLDKIDALLAQAGTSKTNIISTQIWLKDIAREYVPQTTRRSSENPALVLCVRCAIDVRCALCAVCGVQCAVCCLRCGGVRCGVCGVLRCKHGTNALHSVSLQLCTDERSVVRVGGRVSRAEGRAGVRGGGDGAAEVVGGD